MNNEKKKEMMKEKKKEKEQESEIGIERERGVSQAKEIMKNKENCHNAAKFVHYLASHEARLFQCSVQFTDCMVLFRVVLLEHKYPPPLFLFFLFFLFLCFGLG